MNRYIIDCQIDGVVISATIEAPDPVEAIRKMFEMENMPPPSTVTRINCKRKKVEQ